MGDAFACNLNGIAVADRGRYRQLVTRVRAALTKRVEISNGYVFDVWPGALNASELAEWMRLERLCCPFLTIELSGFEKLTLSGAPGIKELIQAEFGAAMPERPAGS
jgi:hypothetical protein